VLQQDLVERHAEMFRNRFDLVARHIDDHPAAAVRALRTIDLTLDFMGQNLKGLNRDIVRMKVAAEVEILDFLRFSQAPDLVGISDQPSKYSFAGRDSYTRLRATNAA
jgi:hypothetical protein